MNTSTAPKHRLVGDFETYYGSEFSLTKMTMPEYVLDPRFQIIGAAFMFNDGEAQWFTGEAEVRAYLDALPWDEGIEFIAHNAMFDGSIMEWHLGYKPARYFCTMMGSRPFITPHTGKMSLAVVSDYLIENGAPIEPKGTEVANAFNMRLGDFSGEQLLKYAAYCITDTVNCSVAENWLRDRYPDDERDLLNFTIMKYTRSPLLLDEEVLTTRLRDVREHKQQLLDECGMSDRKALMSNDLFAQTLESMGVEVPMKPSPSNPSKLIYAFAKKDKGMLELMEHPDERVQAVVSARLGHKSTIEETRLERLRNICRTARGRLPVALLYYGAHTGRFSGYDKTNLQNLPRGSELRRAIIAPPQHRIVAADLSQIEARIVAWLANETDLVDAFATGRDIYCEFATKAFGYEVTPDMKFPERFVGKTCILGLGYGMGGTKLQATLAAGGVELTEGECKRMVDLYRRTYKRIPELWREAEKLLPVMANDPTDRPGFRSLGPITAMPGKMILPNGMPITYTELHMDAVDGGWTAKCGGRLRHLWGGALVENMVQSLARLVIARAELFLANRGLPAAMQVHDELIYVAHENQVDKLQQALEMTLTRPVPWAEGLPVACEVAHGMNYADAK